MPLQLARGVLLSVSWKPHSYCRRQAGVNRAHTADDVGTDRLCAHQYYSIPRMPGVSSLTQPELQPRHTAPLATNVVHNLPTEGKRRSKVYRGADATRRQANTISLFGRSVCMTQLTSICS